MKTRTDLAAARSGRVGKTVNADVSVSMGPLKLTLSGLNGRLPAGTRERLERVLLDELHVDISSILVQLGILDYEPVFRTD